MKIQINWSEQVTTWIAGPRFIHSRVPPFIIFFLLKFQQNLIRTSSMIILYQSSTFHSAEISARLVNCSICDIHHILEKCGKFSPSPTNVYSFHLFHELCNCITCSVAYSPQAKLFSRLPHFFSIVNIHFAKCHIM